MIQNLTQFPTRVIMSNIIRKYSQKTKTISRSLIYSFILIFSFIGLTQNIKAQTTLGSGDIAVAAVNSANPDKISIVLLKSIAANTVINITDNGFTSTTAGRTGEGFLTFTAPTSLTAGTILTWTNGMTITGTGWSSNAPSNFALNGSGDQLFIFQGSTTNWVTQTGITLIYGLNYGTVLSATSSASNTVQPSTTLLPSTAFLNLPNVTNANGYFANGSSATSSVSVSGTASAVLALLIDATKWVGTTASAATFPAYSFTIGSGTSPVISSSTATQNTTVLSAYAGYTITASNTPTSYSATGIPSGLSVDTSTGAISGTPTTGSVGTYTVTATATNGSGSGTATFLLNVNKANQSITFGSLANKTVGDPAITLGATASSGLAVSYATSDAGVAALSGNSLSFPGAGIATITASQAGNADYNAATNVTQNQLVNSASLLNQTISFTQSSPVTYAVLPITLSATSTSGLSVSFASSDNSIGSINGNTLTINKVGTFTITASQAGNASYNAASDVTQVLVVNPKGLSITGATASNKVYDGTTAASISGATLSGVVGTDNVALSAAGATFASANVGNAINVTTAYTLVNSTAANYSIVAQPSGLSADITIAGQSITFTLPTTTTTAASPITLNGAASSGLGVSYVSTNTLVATLSGNQLILVGSGTTTVTASQAGNSNYTAAADVLQTITVTAAPTLTEVILPQYIQGIASGTTNTSRLPFAYRATLNNLLPNATYRYINGVELASVTTYTAVGAGNGIYTDGNPANAFTATTGPSLSTPGNYGSFTTDVNGAYTGWFIISPSGNSRFLAGTDIKPRIGLNDGANGTTLATVLSTTNSVRVLSLTAAAGANNATGLRGLSNATAKNFVFTFDNTTGSGRPLSGSFVESDGFAETTSYATFYTASVDGVTGAYGLLTPNTNANGVQRIEQRDIANGTIIGCPAIDADGTWPSGVNTSNPTGGTTALALTSTDAPLGGSFIITASAGSNGVISPIGATNVSCGNNQSFTISPNSGFAVADVLVNGSSIGAVTSYTFADVRAANTIAVSFIAIGPTSSIISGSTTICNGSNGTVSVAVNGGTSPYSVVISDGTTNYSATGISPVTFTVAPSTSKTYTIVSVVDANNIVGSGSSGSAIISVNQLSTPTTIALTPACGVTSVTLPNGASTSNTNAVVTYTNVAGCDSVVTYNITYKVPSASMNAMSNCTAITWNGQSVAATGTYTASFTNAAGCDSIATLNFTKLNATSSTISITQFFSYVIPGTTTTITTSGTTNQVYTAANTCDSTVTYNVTIKGLVLCAKAFLSGPYNATTGLMTDSLRQKGLLPLSTPYGSGTYTLGYTSVNNISTETTTPAVLSVTGNNAIVDWVFVQIRSKADSSIVLGTRSALMQRDGDIVDMDGTSPLKFADFLPDNFFVSIKHRNHIGIMTANKYALSLTPNCIDFTTTSTPLFIQPGKKGNPAPLTGPTRIQNGVRTLYAGNCNILTALTSRFITYNVLTTSDRNELYVATGGTNTLNTYTIYDVDMNGFARFNGLDPDRNVILSNCAGSNSLITNEQTPN